MTGKLDWNQNFVFVFVNKTQRWIVHSPDFTRLTGTLLEEAFFSITAALQLWICWCVCFFTDGTWSNATKSSSPFKFSLKSADMMLLLSWCYRKFNLGQEPDVQVVIMWWISMSPHVTLILPCFIGFILYSLEMHHILEFSYFQILLVLEGAAVLELTPPLS